MLFVISALHDPDLYTNRAFVAVENDQSTILASLIENGLQVNCHNNIGDRLIVHAMLHHGLKCMRLLVAHGADINTPCPNGHTPISRLCVEDNSFDKELEFLVHVGANINVCNVMAKSPLLLAVESNNFSHVKVLLQNGANVLLLVAFATNILSKALVSQHFDIAELLINHGADVNMCDWYNVSPLLAALQTNPQKKDREIYFPMLIDAGADINISSGSGNSPFLQAIFNRDDSLVEILLMKQYKLGKTCTLNPEVHNRLVLALDMLCSNSAVNNINLMFFGCGEHCDVKKIYNKHPIIYRMQECGELCSLDSHCKQNTRASRDPSTKEPFELLKFCRKIIRRTLSTQTNINLYFLVRRLYLPSQLQNYILFKY